MRNNFPEHGSKFCRERLRAEGVELVVGAGANDANDEKVNDAKCEPNDGGDRLVFVADPIRNGNENAEEEILQKAEQRDLKERDSMRIPASFLGLSWRY